MGAVVAEVVAEELSRAVEESADRVLRDGRESKTTLSPAEFRSHLQQEMVTAVDMGKMASALVAFLAQQDVTVSIETATIALENNFSFSAEKIVDHLTDGYTFLLEEGSELIADGARAGLETIEEIGQDIVDRPGFYGATALECVPGGLGVVATVGHQGYRVSTGETTGSQAAVEVGTDVFLGFFGVKALKTLKVSGRFVIAAFAAKLAERRAFKALGAVDPSAQFWTKTVQFKGNKVYQRNDLIDPRRVDKRGRTNIERMQRGDAPIGPDGNSVNLHHMLQTHDGSIAEVTKTFHKKYSKVIDINPPTTPSGIHRGQFESWKAAYWRARAKDFQ